MSHLTEDLTSIRSPAMKVEENKDGGNEEQEIKYIDSQNNNLTKIQVPKYLKKYNIKPSLRGVNKILYLNAQDIKYYERDLKEPRLNIWLLRPTSDDEESTIYNYSIKRIIEESYRCNIQSRVKLTHNFDMVCSSEGLDQILYNGVVIKKEELPDAVIPRLSAKIDYFSLSLLRHLEKMGVHIINETESLENSKDKLFTVRALSENKMPIPKTLLAKFPLQKNVISSVFGQYPVILKVASGAQGKGVMLIKDEDTLEDIGHMINPGMTYIIQEFIKNSSGRDIRVIVIGDKAVGAMMRIANKGFKSNFSAGGYVKLAKLNEKLEWLAVEVTKICKLQISGVDILIDKDTYRICEINSTPGFEGFELATGVNVALKILEYAVRQCGIKKLQPKKKNKETVHVDVHVEHLLPGEQNQKGGSSTSTKDALHQEEKEKK